MTSAGRAPALLAIALLSASLGCQRTDGEPVQLGPEAKPAEIQAALSGPLAQSHPASMRAGTFAYWRDIQTLAASVSMTIADTGQTIDSRDDATDANYVIFNLIERKLTYVGQESREVVTEREASAPKPTPAAGPSSGTTAAAIASGLALLQAPTAIFFHSPVFYRSPGARADAAPIAPVSTIALGRGWSTPFGWTDSGFAPYLSGLASVVTGSAAAPKATGPRVSYHGLRVTTVHVAPPDLVRQRPDCGGLPGCAMTLYTIAFDQATWLSSQPDKIHFEFQISPDVPYLASLINRCATAMVPIGNTKTLFSQCSPVMDFHF